MAKALITTVPFGEKDRLPLELLKKAKIEYHKYLSFRNLRDLSLAKKYKRKIGIIHRAVYLDKRAKAKNIPNKTLCFLLFSS